MASFSSPLTFSAGALIRLPSPPPSAAGQAFEVRPIPGVVPPPPLREEPQARQSRQDLAQDSEADSRGRARRTDQGSFGQSRLRYSPAPSLAPEDFATSAFLAQILGQNPGSTTNVVALHRDGPTLSSEAYRRAGGEPTLYSEQPRILRIAV